MPGRGRCCGCPRLSDSNCEVIPLCKAKAGKRLRVSRVDGERGLCACMSALGIYPGAEMQLLCEGCVRVNGGILSLGEDISENILVTAST